MKAGPNRNVFAGGRRTSMRHPEPTWQALRDICAREFLTLPTLIAMAEGTHPDLGRSAAVRAYALAYWRRAALDAERASGSARRLAPSRAADAPAPGCHDMHEGMCP